MSNKKKMWLALLLVAIGLFLLGLYTQQLLYFFVTIGVSFWIRQKGYDSLFKAFDDEQKAKRIRTEGLMKGIREKKGCEKSNRS